MMDKQEIINIGEVLAKELAKASSKYSIKSDHYDILGYESAEIEKIAKSIKNGSADTSMLSQSTLLSDWGAILEHDIPELILKVKQYRKLCEEFLNPNVT